MSENEWVTGKVGLRIGNVPLDLEMTVPARPVKPHRMLPIFHQMANSFADIGVQAAEHEGKSISCKAGCGACCRQPVPISEIEAYQITDLVESMPEPRRSVIKGRFAAALRRFEDLGWFEKFRSEYLRKKTNLAEVAKAVTLAHDYFDEKVPCPFLEDESCSIHLDRPVSCREYFVTSSPTNCASLDGKNIEMVTLPIKPTKSLNKLARTDDGKRAGQILLIQALQYVNDHPEHFEEKTGEQWMAEFFSELTSEETAVPKSEPISDKNLRKKRKRRHAKH